MSKKSSAFAKRALLVAYGGALASTLPRADAQESAAPVGTLSIEVTGTHLKRTDSETALPLQVFTREDLQKGGIQTVQDLLERVSANQSFGAFNEALGEGNPRVGFTAA